MGFDRSDLIPTNIRLAAANQGAIYVTGRNPIISLQLGGRHLWISFLVVKNLDESDQFILGRDFVRNFDVTIDLNDGLIRIKDPERKFEKKLLNKILINQAKMPIFLDRKVRLKPNQAVVATFGTRSLNELSNEGQVCLVPNPNSKISAILGRSFSLTQSGLCVSVLLNTEATTVTIQREKKLFKADVFSKHKADIRCCKFVELEIEIEEGSVPHREGARRMTPHKLEACRMLVEMLMEYDMIEPSKSPWACGVVMAKKQGAQLRFCCDFRYPNAVTIKDA